MSSATLAQLSMARPTLLVAAARKLKKGARSGVHMSTPNWLASFSTHRTTVARGITTSSWSRALTRLCTPSARFRSSRGYTSRSSGAASVEQKARTTCTPYTAISRTSAMLVSRSSTPCSGCRQVRPWHEKDSKKRTSSSARCCTRPTMAVTSCTRVSAWSIRMGSRPCTPSVFRNHTVLFQSGRIARRSRSTMRSGTSTVCCTYGPMNLL